MYIIPATRGRLVAHPYSFEKPLQRGEEEKLILTEQLGLWYTY